MRPGSWAISEVASSTAATVDSAWAARVFRFVATKSKDFFTRSVAWSRLAAAASCAGGRTGGASLTTLPTAEPRPTPIPVSCFPAWLVGVGVVVVMGSIQLLDGGGWGGVLGPDRGSVHPRSGPVRAGSVVVDFQQLDQLVQGGVSAVALGGQGDLVVVADGQAHDHQDAAGVDGVAVTLGDGDRQPGRGDGLDEQRGRAGVQADAGRDLDLAGGHSST